MINDTPSLLVKYKVLLALLLVPVLIISCASIASPTGGDFDFDPPKIVKATPELGAINVKSNKIQLVFDELVQIDKPSEKIIITPPQHKNPVIQAISNRVSVTLKDSLLPNTTYTIDFTDAIVDNNEQNALENFSFSFSTGDKIDSLAVSGKVLAAEDLEPIKGIFVGLHSDLNDSAFVKKPFERISRTNDKGEFTIRGVKEGKYRIYALDDINKSYKYENPGNAIAFSDSIIVPSHTRSIRPDTIFHKDFSVDTVIYEHYTRFMPDDIVLRSFTSAFKRQYLQKFVRAEKEQLHIYFGNPTDLPKIKPLNFEDKKDWYELERNAGNDSINYWIKDAQIAQMDTISLQVTYNVTDSLNNVVSKTDTLKFSYKEKVVTKEKPKKPKKGEVIEDDLLKVDVSITGILDVYDSIKVQFEKPIIDFDEKKFTLQQLVDSVYVDTEFRVSQNTLNPREYTFTKKWKAGSEYIFAADSAVFHSYSGLPAKKIYNKFKIKELTEYGNLFIETLGIDSVASAFVELLDASDKPLRKSQVKDGGALFKNLAPAKYYVRLVLDKNGNGVWDTGDYSEKKEPEMVFYCDRAFEVKANWNMEELWDVNTVSIDKQKPLEITKNKPQEKDSKRKQMEKEEKSKRNKEKEEQQQRDELNNNRYRK